MTSDEKEELEFQKESNAEEARIKMIDDYNSLKDLIYFPPLNLLINYRPFTSEIVDALNKLHSLQEYDENLFGKIKKRYSKEIESARAAMKKHNSTREATLEYISKNKNSVDITDFANIHLVVKK
jgi:hypothetical protein